MDALTGCQCAVCTMARLREEAKFKQMREDMPKIIEAIKLSPPPKDR